MSAPRREGYRKPTQAEAANFAAINGKWLKMRRRQRRRLAVQWAASVVLVVAIGAIGAALLWLLVVGSIVLFDGIANL